MRSVGMQENKCGGIKIYGSAIIGELEQIFYVNSGSSSIDVSFGVYIVQEK